MGKPSVMSSKSFLNTGGCGAHCGGSDCHLIPPNSQLNQKLQKKWSVSGAEIGNLLFYDGTCS